MPTAVFTYPVTHVDLMVRDIVQVFPAPSILHRADLEHRPHHPQDLIRDRRLVI